MSYKQRGVEKDSVGKHCELSNRELYIKRREIRKAVYAGFTTIGISIPIVIVNYLPLINNFIKTHDVDARTIGSIGVAVGTNLVANGLLRSYEYFNNITEINKRFEELKNIKREEFKKNKEESDNTVIKTVIERNRKNKRTVSASWKKDSYRKFR